MATPTTTGTVQPSGPKAPFPAFDPKYFGGQLLWLAIAFGLLYYLMAKHAIPRIREILETRSDQIADDLSEAQRLRAETDAAIEAYEKSLAEARAKAQALASEARDKAQAAADADRKALETKLSKDMEAAEATIAATKTKAMGNVRAIALEAAEAIVGQLAGKPAKAALETAVDAALKR